MKKVTAIILALVLALTLTGCDGKDLEEKISSAADRIEAGAENLGDKLSGLGDKLSGASEPDPEPTDAPEPTAAPEEAEAAAALTQTSGRRSKSLSTLTRSFSVNTWIS